MSFCTVINCMDGRVQLPVNTYLRQRFGVDYVDTITEAGPVRIVADRPDSAAMESILSRVDISLRRHASEAISIVAHWDCGGNPIGDDAQKAQLAIATTFLADRYRHIGVLALWVDATWAVTEVGSAHL